MTAIADFLLRTIPTLWFGMVLAISFVEAPLKFRAPGLTLQVGLGIGRIVFHALNAFELVFALVVAAAMFGAARGGDLTGTTMRVSLAIAIVVLLVQVFALRPALDRRLDARVRGETVAPSKHHVTYIGLEVGKLLALGTAGVTIALAARNGG